MGPRFRRRSVDERSSSTKTSSALRKHPHRGRRGLSFTVEEGEIFGILGPNGAGKTTTVECIAGLRTPDAGSITRPRSRPAGRSRPAPRAIGVQLQESALRRRSPSGEALELYASFYPQPADWRELIDDARPHRQARPAFGKLSGGQKQRLSIALALRRQPADRHPRRAHHRPRPAARRDTWELIDGVRDRGVTPAARHPLHGRGRAPLRPARADRRRPRSCALDTPAGIWSRGRHEQRTPVPAVRSDRRRDCSPAARGPRPSAAAAPTGSSIGHREPAAGGRLGPGRPAARRRRAAARAGHLDDAFVRLTGAVTRSLSSLETPTLTESARRPHWRASVRVGQQQRVEPARQPDSTQDAADREQRSRHVRGCR